MNENVLGLLDSSCEHFRRGEDIEGIKDFSSGIDRLKRMQDPSFGLKGSALSGFLSAVERLLSCIQNGDITGLTDTLEFSLCPTIRGQIGGAANDSTK